MGIDATLFELSRTDSLFETLRSDAEMPGFLPFLGNLHENDLSGIRSILEGLNDVAAERFLKQASGMLRRDPRLLGSWVELHKDGLWIETHFKRLANDRRSDQLVHDAFQGRSPLHPDGKTSTGSLVGFNEAKNCAQIAAWLREINRGMLVRVIDVAEPGYGRSDFKWMADRMDEVRYELSQFYSAVADRVNVVAVVWE